MSLEKILTLTNINDITDMVSTYLKKPVVIENDQFLLLAYSSYYIEHFDQANRQTIFTKHWPIPILEKFMDEGIVEQLKTVEHPFRVKQIEEIGLNQRVVVSAVHKGQVFGFIWVQETEMMTDSDLEFLHEVSHHIGKLLYQKKQINMKKDEEKNEFYQKVIDEVYQTENQIKWEAANMSLLIPETFLVNVFTIAQSDAEHFDELADTVSLFANALNHFTHVFTNQLKIIVLIGSNGKGKDLLTDSANDLTNTVLSQFNDKKVFPGIGNEYSSILQLRKSYLEALEVINAAKFIGEPEQLPFQYSKIGIFRYLEMISNHHTKTNYINTDLEILQKKDLESQTKLLQTLEIYLLNNCRIKPTSEQLYIHTNTLKYRLNQITDLTSIDFDDFHSRMQLYIDLQLIKQRF
ncbi:MULTISPECIES: PucR family transcriptional regulator [Peribacillus]|uniref:Helix-turn-helix domain-containing protein n=1 Tax=Peribacillus castrilensis TaxID=2897690 RepID=A0AAW9N9F8_9BACI|nr:helix-turn-helix domain-containing protein [Peribacillus frigoritolerans]MEC0272093.1 helix-turn-helix domain-containing protein [Peribacillus castrilensis]MEC0346578.1 helix-turn-helix domain-containing protein [Peribacillus castrilensis]TFH61502.1 PucR family transcriptional regulator [Peribacillus frigoritolerans]